MSSYVFFVIRNKVVRIIMMMVSVLVIDLMFDCIGFFFCDLCLIGFFEG